MLRLLASLGALLALVLGGPLLVAAQDATPAAETPPAPEGTAGPELARTNVRYFLPWTPSGLNPGLAVTHHESGTCDVRSAADAARPDAWRCATPVPIDPCFENPFADPDGPVDLACADSPFSGNVVLFTTAGPLRREKADGADPAPGSRREGEDPAPPRSPGHSNWPMAHDARRSPAPPPSSPACASTTPATTRDRSSATSIAASRFGPSRTCRLTAPPAS